MRNTRLSDFKSKKSSYFKSLGNIQFSSRKETDYIAYRSYEALPKKLKEFLKEDKRQIIKTTSNLVNVSGESGLDVYQALKALAENRYSKVYSEQKKEVWDLFKKEETSVYNHYNSYIYRLGYSASKYWFENVKFSNVEGSLVTTSLELPVKMKGTIYTTLEIIYDYSTHFLQAIMY